MNYLITLELCLGLISIAVAFSCTTSRGYLTLVIMATCMMAFPSLRLMTAVQ